MHIAALWGLAIVWFFVLNDPVCGYIFVTEEHARRRQCGFFDFSRPLICSLWTSACLCCPFPVFMFLLPRPSGKQVI